jgi:predicted transcriptional regulator
VLKDTPLFVVLNLLAERKISAVPVIDENGAVIDIYCRSDVTSLIKQVTFNFLSSPVGEILEYKKKEAIYTCKKTETLETVLERLVETRVYRLVIVDSTNRIVGIVSLSDILKCFIT